MKSKKKENKKYYRLQLSPNFDEKRKRNIKYIIIHYTGVQSNKYSLEIFNNKESKVSCHWLISKKGKIYKIVEEKNIAWHCGISNWKKITDLNRYSIGIELDNPGHGINYKKFPLSQMNSLVFLLRKAINKYNINYKNILGHSDICPERKTDPGELFDWGFLAKKKLAFYPDLENKKKNSVVMYKLGDQNPALLETKKLLNNIGYNCQLNNRFDLKFKSIVEAFQRRFFPQEINGIITNNLYVRIKQISNNS